jgi:Rrf2 family protein
MPVSHSVLGRDLAGGAGIPPNYLSKILLALRNAGIVTTARGTGGGYRLLKPADQIRLVEIVELIDGARARPACLLDSGRKCLDSDPCPAHESWREVRTAYIQFLESTTLAALSQSGARAQASE